MTVFYEPLNMSETILGTFITISHLILLIALERLIILSPFYRWKVWDLKSLRNFLKIVQLLSGLVVLLLNWCSLSSRN